MPGDAVTPSGSAGVVAAVVVAGGTGARLDADRPKAFVEVAGTTLLAHAVAGVRAGGIDRVVVVVPSGWEAEAARLLDDVAVVVGGATRTASVAAGLEALGDDVDVVAVHDAARAFVPADVVATVVAAVRADGVVAAAPGLAVGDTLKRVDGDTVVDTVDRADLVAVQTPQVFPRPVLEQAHRRAATAGAAATDDLALVEALVADGTIDGRVVVTPGSPRALKVTRPEDLELAEGLARTAVRMGGGAA